MNSTSNYTTLQPLLFDFSQYSTVHCLNLTKKETEFASIWNSIVSMIPSYAFEVNRIGRKGYALVDILAVRSIMLFFKQNNIKQTLSFIEGSPNVKAIVGMDTIPSASVVSRKTDEVNHLIDIESIYDKTVKEFYGNRLICNLSIDSTPIDATKNQ